MGAQQYMAWTYCMKRHTTPNVKTHENVHELTPSSTIIMDDMLLSGFQRVSWPHTFSSLRIGDLQVAVCGLEPLSAHYLLFKLVEGDMQPIESDSVVVQFGRELIVNTRHFNKSKHLSQSSTRKKNTGVV